MNLTIGSTAGDYQVIGILGAGGMGQVYKVRNVISDRVEAMKVLLPDLVNQHELADRFLREIKVQAGLEHANIAQLRTALRYENQLLMLMEFVEGETLEHKLSSGPLLPQVAVEYIMQALSALDYAHAQGVVHRDVKPANMIVTNAGVLKLMDFGIAKVADDHRLTMTGTTLGSLYYMSPEQIQGATNLDGRSDLYSMGVALYELVTGKRPFDGSSQFAIMQAHLTSSPTPPVKIDPELPASLNAVILTAVKREAGERFQSAAAFRNALQAVAAELKGQPVRPLGPVPLPLSPPAPPFRKPTDVPVIAMAKPPSKLRGMWIATGALVAVLAMLAVVQFGPRKNATAAPASIEAPPPSAPAAVTVPLSEPQPQAPPTAEPQSVPAQEQRKSAVASPIGAAKPAAPDKSSIAKSGSSAPRSLAPPDASPSSPPVATVQSPVVPAQALPQTPSTRGPSPEALQRTREQIAMLSVRGAGIRTSLQAIQRSQGTSGLNLRGDMQEAANLMTTYLDGATAALNAGDLNNAGSFAEKAERQIEKLEKFLNR